MVLLEQIINSNYIKYDRLVNMVNRAFVNSTARNLNIYIDLYSIFKGLYKNKNYNIDDYSTVTSCIINMVAHYRQFFRSRYNTETKFYIVYSKNCCYINNQFYKGYNSKNAYAFNMNKLVDDMIHNNIELLETLCPYLPDVFFIKSQFETGVVIYDLICKDEALNIASPNLIITKDIYNYQLAAMRDNIVIFRPKKSNGIDSSYYIDKNNLLLYYLVSRKSNSMDEIKNLSPELLSLLMTISSVSDRNIKMMTNIKNAISILNSAVKDCRILNGYNYLTNTLYDSLKIDNYINKIDFENRFKAIDIQYQHLIFVNTVESQSMKLLNLVDNDAVRQINNVYFKKNPLDLNNL